MMQNELKIEARNIPELYKILCKKFNIKEVKGINRKFLRFEGVNFVYIYKVKFILQKKTELCTNKECPDKIIKGEPSWHNGKKVCQYCYQVLTKGYYPNTGNNKKLYKPKIIKLFS